MSDIAVHITALILIALKSGGLGLVYGLTRGVGPMGPMGPIGIQGFKGDNGPMGIKGIKGPKGDRGYPGSNYATGESNNE